MKLSYHVWSDWVQSMTKTKHDNHMTNLYIWFTPKPKLNCRDQFDQLWFVMKTKQDNNVTNIGAVYVDCDENHIGQLHD